MSHCITNPPPIITSNSGLFKVHQVPAASDNLVWLIEYESGKCAAVDGPSAKEVLAYCVSYQLELTTILNTHTHGDHVGINHDLYRLGQLDGMTIYGSALRKNDVPYITHPVNEGDCIALGPLSGMVWLTEGHIDGHISFIFEEFLFCGDTLFAGGCGYLFDGPPSKMYDSLQRMMTLPADTFVCCAHEYTLDNLNFAMSVEPNNQTLQKRWHLVQQMRANGESSLPSTIGLELETNPFLRVDSLEIQQHLQSSINLDSTKCDIFAAIRNLKNQKLYKK